MPHQLVVRIENKKLQHEKQLSVQKSELIAGQLQACTLQHMTCASSPLGYTQLPKL